MINLGIIISYQIVSNIVGDEPRKAKSGNDMPLPRYLRTQFLSVGHVPSNKFTYLSTYGWVLLSSDIASLHDTGNYATLYLFEIHLERDVDFFVSTFEIVLTRTHKGEVYYYMHPEQQISITNISLPLRNGVVLEELFRGDKKHFYSIKTSHLQGLHHHFDVMQD